MLVESSQKHDVCRCEKQWYITFTEYLYVQWIDDHQWNLLRKFKSHSWVDYVFDTQHFIKQTRHQQAPLKYALPLERSVLSLHCSIAIPNLWETMAHLTSFGVLCGPLSALLKGLGVLSPVAPGLAWFRTSQRQGRAGGVHAEMVKGQVQGTSLASQLLDQPVRGQPPMWTTMWTS